MKNKFLHIVALSLFGSQLSLGQIFEDKSELLGSHAIYLRTMDVQVADLNKDGYLDIVLAVEWAPNAILWGGKSGNFRDNHAAKLSRNKYDSEDIAIADFDGDGWLDLVFAAEDDMNHEMYLNKKNGSFEDVSDRLPKFISNAVQTADINGDGHMDLVFGNQGQNKIFVNNGKGFFKEETENRFPSDNTTTQDLVIVDVDYDGDLDIIFGNEDGNQLWINQGNGIFKDETATRFPQYNDVETRKVTLIDANKDGFIDVFLSNVASLEGKNNQDHLYLNDGKGNFKDVTSTHLPSYNIETLDAIVFDINKDGHTDLVLAFMGKNQPQVLVNDGKGKFTLSDKYLPQVSGNNISILKADFNKDKKQDLYIGGFMTEDKLLLQK